MCVIITQSVLGADKSTSVSKEIPHLLQNKNFEFEVLMSVNEECCFLGCDAL
jgi:hypothetical protein